MSAFFHFAATFAQTELIFVFVDQLCRILNTLTNTRLQVKEDKANGSGLTLHAMLICLTASQFILKMEV